MAATFQRYGETWKAEADALTVELSAISMGGTWKSRAGHACGLGLFGHMMNARRLLWPDRYRHRWTDLLYHNFIENDITIAAGCASAQKTSHASEYALINYFARPDDTLVILSTITVEKLDTGVWGELKMLWNDARRRYPWVPGNLLEHRRAITTDSVSRDADTEEGEATVRDLRRGCVSKPCYSGGKWIGLGTLAGIKQKHIIYLADELQFMAEAFTASWANLFSNGNVKILGSGNFKHDPDDQLGIAAEPKDGWPSVPNDGKTKVWETRFMSGKCVNLVGTDSPNMDVAEGQPEPYPGLIGRKFIKRIAHDWGEDSPQYYSQARGEMRIDMADKRVVTRLLCRQHNAHDKAVWAGTQQPTRVYGLDPSYGGADLCIGVVLEFGDGLDGLPIVRFAELRVITIRMGLDISPEDQVAGAVADDLNRLNIPVENCFYDPYGKGTMGAAFARKFGFRTPVPVDSGGPTTNRPVRDDLRVYDDVKGTSRLKTCAEHYSKFVTEAWFSVRYTIEADQFRELPMDVMQEGCSRKYSEVAGNKIAVEPKDDYRERTGKSPNKFDALAVGVEGCRQRGFTIARLGKGVAPKDEDEDWFEKEAKEYRDAIKTKLLKHR